eukprot:g16777.t1
MPRRVVQSTFAAPTLCFASIRFPEALRCRPLDLAELSTPVRPRDVVMEEAGLPHSREELMDRLTLAV